MKRKDIQIGQEYQIAYGIRGKVLEVGVATTTYTGKSRMDGVKVQIMEGNRAGVVTVYSTRNIRRPWSEHAKELEAREKARRYQEEVMAEREARVSQVEQELADLGIRTRQVSFNRWESRDDNQFGITLQIDSDHLGEILERLGEAGLDFSDGQPQQTQQAPSSALAELLG